MTTAIKERIAETTDNLASLDFDELFRPFRTDGVEERRVALLARKPGAASVKVSRWVYAPDLDESKVGSLMAVVRLRYGLDRTWEVSIAASSRRPKAGQPLV